MTKNQNQNQNVVNNLNPVAVEKAPVEGGLKVLWWSNAVHTGTGYGVQTSNVAYRLRGQGVNLRVAANYGLDGAALGFNNLVQYPRTGFSEVGEDTLRIVCENWQPQVLVTLFDVWVGHYSRYFNAEDWLSKLHKRWIAWLPVDSDPIAEAVADQAGKAYRAVAMSKFGYTQLKQAGVKDARYIPHGVETQVFTPSPDKAANKVWLDKHTQSITMQSPVSKTTVEVHIQGEDFVIGVNKANKDPQRADYDRMLYAVKLFLDSEPDARKDTKLVLHTWTGFPGGTNIKKLVHDFGLDANVKVTHEYDMLCGLTPQALNSVYGGFDVLMNLARGEGFGVPILEAAACGVPSIATDYTAMTELVSGHGWLVPLFAKNYHGGCKLRNGLNSLWGVPDEYEAADMLIDAYSHPEKRRVFGEKARLWSLNYDFDKYVVPMWRSLLGEVESELGMTGASVQKQTEFESLRKQILGAT